MKFSTSIMAITALFASVEGIEAASIFDCCREARGSLGGNQCLAGQTSPRLSTFAK
ncbi:uncharacterized protein TrAFT101_008045 [Trichoderma asperellum]|uniref:uncharacterized protein n=1 Tax=Trichoderma asperellum TaxID=101201 RepID=UPI00331DB652|nr:hypothetical protein TrAFT101_008045 [Trichoderma asperellum]